MLTSLLAIILGTSIFTVAIAQATIVWKAMHSTTEKPEVAGKVMVLMAVGLGMLESLVLYALIVFLIVNGV